MRIAQVAPLIESVPPLLYGGTERIVSYLTEELVRRRHEVTLFASGDSRTQAELAHCAPRALRLAEVVDPIPFNVLQLEKIRKRAGEFDVLHFHMDFLHWPLFREISRSCVTTMHGRLDLPGYLPLFSEFPEMPLVSISDHQRGDLPGRWMATIHHGLPAQLYTLASPAAGRGYLVFLGRISVEKRPDRAIEIAIRAGMELKIAAKVDRVDQEYFDEVIRPLLKHPRIEFIGEVKDHEKQALLGGAHALLFPIDWPEPFGLVMIEAMACGTPVIAWRRGSVPEIIEHGASGYIVETISEAAAAVERAGGLSRESVRRCFETRFTVERMAQDYLGVYETLALGQGEGRKAIRFAEAQRRPLQHSLDEGAPPFEDQAVLTRASQSVERRRGRR